MRCVDLEWEMGDLTLYSLRIPCIPSADTAAQGCAYGKPKRV